MSSRHVWLAVNCADVRFLVLRDVDAACRLLVDVSLGVRECIECNVKKVSDGVGAYIYRRGAECGER
jgi:hypothetical protein